MHSGIDLVPTSSRYDVPRLETYRYHDQLRDDAEQFLFHPSLQKLLIAAADEGYVSEAELFDLAATSNDQSAYTATLTHLVNKALYQRTPDMERFQLTDDGVSAEFCDAIKCAAGELAMIAGRPIPDEDFEIAAVLGATVTPIANRTNFLYDSLERGNGRARLLIGLGAERPMLPPDIKSTAAYPYVAQSKVETNLLSYAAQDWFARNGYDTPVVDHNLVSTSRLYDASYDSPYSFQTVCFSDEQRRPDWAPEAIINISAPYNKTHHSRANTGETIEFMYRLADLQPGDNVLFISHQPYLLGQAFEINRICFEKGIRAYVAGYEANNPDLPAVAWGDEIAKATTKACELLAALDAATADQAPTLRAAA